MLMFRLYRRESFGQTKKKVCHLHNDGFQCSRSGSDGGWCFAAAEVDFYSRSASCSWAYCSGMAFLIFSGLLSGMGCFLAYSLAIGASRPRPFRGSGNGLAEQFRRVNAKGGGEFYNFRIRHPADLAFDPGNDVAAHVPAGDIQPGGKGGLGESPSLAQLAHDRPHNVSRRFHPLTVPKSVRVCVWNSTHSRNPEMKGNFMFLRRLGENGRANCMSGHNCPQILEILWKGILRLSAWIPERKRSRRRPFWGSGDGHADQIRRLHANANGQNGDFIIRHATELGLDFRQGPPAQIPTDDVDLGDKLRLGEPLFHPQLADDGANDILVLGHLL